MASIQEKREEILAEQTIIREDLKGLSDKVNKARKRYAELQGGLEALKAVEEEEEVVPSKGFG